MNYYSGMAITVGLVISYYLALIWYFRLPSRTTIIGIDAGELSKEFSPIALRYLWLGESDWAMLIVACVEAVQKRVYKISGRGENGRFRVRLYNWVAFGSLHRDTQVALTLGKNSPLNEISIVPETNNVMESLMERLDTYLYGLYGKNLLNRIFWIRIGVILNIILSLTVWATFTYEFYVEILLLYLVIMILIPFVSYIAFIRILTERSELRKRLMIFFYFLFCFLFGSIGWGTTYLFAIFFALQFVHAYFYQKLPRLSKAGQQIHFRIEGYRQWLINKPYPEPIDIPFMIALNVSQGEDAKDWMDESFLQLPSAKTSSQYKRG